MRALTCTSCRRVCRVVDVYLSSLRLYAYGSAPYILFNSKSPEVMSSFSASRTRAWTPCSSSGSSISATSAAAPGTASLINHLHGCLGANAARVSPTLYIPVVCLRLYGGFRSSRMVGCLIFNVILFTCSMAIMRTRTHTTQNYSRHNIYTQSGRIILCFIANTSLAHAHVHALAQR